MKTKLHYLLFALLLSFGMNAQVRVWLTGNGVGGWAEGGKIELIETGVGTGIYVKTNFQIVGDGLTTNESSHIKFTEGTWASAAGPVGGGAGSWPSGVTEIIANSPNIWAQPGWWSVTYNFVTKAYSFVPGVNPLRNISLDGSAVPGGTLALVSADGVNYSKESITFLTSGTAQIVEKVSDVAPTPTANWSLGAFPGGIGVQGGALIPTEPGTYYLFFNATTGVYNFDPIAVGLIGVNGDWSNDLLMDTTDNILFTIDGVVLTGADNNFKIRDNSNWNFQFGQAVDGAATPPSGTAVSSGTKDFHLVPGTYNVTFNRSTLAYTFTSVYPVVKFSSSHATPLEKQLGSADMGVTYKGLDIVFDNIGGTGAINEFASVTNPGPTFGSWPVSAVPVSGAWNVDFAYLTGTATWSPTVVALVGEFNSWGDTDMTSTDGISYTLNNVVFTAPRSKFKVRDNHAWAVQFGGAADLVSPAVSDASGTLSTNSKDMWIAAGTYNFTFNRITLAYTITNALAVNKFDANKFSVYPNPTTNSWNFTSGNSDITSVRIVDMLGKTVMSKKGSSNEVSVDASSLSKGMYFAEIVAGNAVQTVKVLRD